MQIEAGESRMPGCCKPDNLPGLPDGIFTAQIPRVLSCVRAIVLCEPRNDLHERHPEAPRRSLPPGTAPGRGRLAISLSQWMADLVRRELATAPPSAPRKPLTWMDAFSGDPEDPFLDRDLPVTDRKALRARRINLRG